MNPISYFKYSFFTGIWTSEKEVEGLDYNSNFMNWTDQTLIPGQLIFEVYLDETKQAYMAALKIPVLSHGGKAHYTISRGKFVVDKNEIIISQNNHSTKINYQRKFNKLMLSVFGEELVFRK